MGKKPGNRGGRIPEMLCKETRSLRISHASEAMRALADIIYRSVQENRKDCPVLAEFNDVWLKAAKKRAKAAK